MPDTIPPDVVKTKPIGPKLVLLSETFHRQAIQRDQSPTIHCLMTLGSIPSPLAVSQKINELIETYPLFRSTVIEHRTFLRSNYHWSTPSLESCSGQSFIENISLTISARPSPVISEGNNNSCDRALRRFVSDKIPDFFDTSRGMFKVYVVKYRVDGEGEEPIKDRCDLVWRIHHGIGDGVLLSKCLESMCEFQNVEGEVTKTKTRKPRKPIPLHRKIWLGLSAFTKTVTLPLTFSDASTGLKASSDYRKLGKAKTYATSKTWSVSELKSVSKKMNCTINDIVMSCLSGGIRRYLQSISDPVILRKKSLKIRALAVVNTRTNMEGLLTAFKNCEAPNEFSYVIPTMPLGSMSEKDRVKQCKKEMDRLKSSPEPFVVRKLNNKIRDVFGGKFVLKFNCDYVVNKFTCFFSNLPGPTGPLKIMGCELKRMSNFVHPMMYGCGLSIQSYNGELVINASCDKEKIQDPGKFMGFVDEVWEELKEGERREEGDSQI
mmetsp:Transcript_511/g.929  ORF Transcript_511/g.929 Transcript_511/m.929 type:complete len:491 (+) Transcript_511:231-1703(+)